MYEKSQTRVLRVVFVVFVVDDVYDYDGDVKRSR
jgi:hypothetical protein